MQVGYHHIGDAVKLQYHHTGHSHFYQTGDNVIMLNNIKALRTKKGLSLAALAELAATSPQQMHRIERGERRLHQEMIYRLAEIFRCSAAEILNVNTEKKLIPLVGYVGAGTTMRCANMMDNPMDWIEPLSVGMSQQFPEGTMFVQVKGNSMIGSADDGDFLWLNSNDVRHGSDVDALLNKRAVVICKDGFNFYKKIRPGTKKGHYNLHSINTPEIMENVQIACAYVVHGVVYK